MGGTVLETVLGTVFVIEYGTVAQSRLNSWADIVIVCCCRRRCRSSRGLVKHAPCSLMPVWSRSCTRCGIVERGFQNALPCGICSSACLRNHRVSPPLTVGVMRCLCVWLISLSSLFISAYFLFSSFSSPCLSPSLSGGLYLDMYVYCLSLAIHLSMFHIRCIHL